MYWWSGFVSTSANFARMRSFVPSSASGTPSSSSMARSSVVTGILRLRSTFTESTSLLLVSNSSQAPRFGMSLP